MNDNKKHFDKLKDEILEHLNTEVERLASRAALILERELKEVINEKAFAGGNLKGAVACEVKKLTWEYMVRVYVNTQYAQYVDEGTKPHFPPLAPIIQWVRKTGLTLNHSAGRNSPGKRFDNYDKDKITAQKIAWKIYKKGTQGIKFFDITLKQAMPLIEKEIKNYKFRISNG